MRKQFDALARQPDVATPTYVQTGLFIAEKRLDKHPFLQALVIVALP